MENNRHEIKTFEDILRVVNEDNMEDFLKDMRQVLKVWCVTEGATHEGAKFTWIDDGKRGGSIKYGSMVGKE